jgi:hypothetical protein
MPDVRSSRPRTPRTVAPIEACPCGEPHSVSRGEDRLRVVEAPGRTRALTPSPLDHIRRMYVDTVCAWPPALRLALDVFGPDRVLFGTDHPFWDPKRTLEAIDALALPPRTSQLIYEADAKRLLGLKRSPKSTATR